MRIPVVVALTLLLNAPVLAQDADLASFFGFQGLEVVKIGQDAGPILAEDMNGDGLTDLVAVNNRASRIELHLQKPNASPEDQVRAATRVNEFPEHWRFRRENVSVSHRIGAVVAIDFDDDELMDLIYAGFPADVVFFRQTSPGVFEMSRRHRVRDLNASRSSFTVHDVLGDERPELITITAGNISIWTLTGDDMGQPTELATGGALVALHVEDYNGDGRPDIAGVIPDDPAPVRMWFGGQEGSRRTLGPQLRFEMPPLREFKSVRLPGESRARLAVIERISRRIVLYEVDTETIESRGDRDVALDVYGFTDAGNRQRDYAIVDLDGDGRNEFIATDTQASSLVAYRQAPRKGLLAGQSYPSLSEITYLDAANVDEDRYAELFVLSEEEGVVGRCDVDEDGVPFPRPINLPDGTTPVAMSIVKLNGEPFVAVICKDGRDYTTEIIDMQGERTSVDLGAQSRAPDTIVALDADQDGLTDLLLFTRDRPMMMLQAGEDGFRLLESDAMGQFGLIKAASAQNTAIFDVDGDDKAELLIADSNYVRAVRYEPDPAEPGVSPGWQVITQMNAIDDSADLVSISILIDQIAAADSANDRILIMAPVADSDAWRQVEALNVRGFEFNDIHAGSFTGDGASNLLAIGDDAFAVIRLSGERVSLRETNAWRTEHDRRMQHELTIGDVNNDGFTDMVSLDAGEQMCEIFTFSEANRMLYAMGFQVYESKLFSGGEPREYQPSMGVIADVTGDGANDLILLAHDRMLIYPQMTERTSTR